MAVEAWWIIERRTNVNTKRLVRHFWITFISKFYFVKGRLVGVAS